MNPFTFAKSKVLADDSLKNHRRDLCNECPSKRIEKFTNVELCDECGCVIKAKTATLHTKCPKDKW